MKKFIISILALILLTWIACVPPVVFSEPQPQGYNPESSFPMHYRGTFFCDSDSSIVYIKNKTVYKEKGYKMISTIEEVDSIDELTIMGDELYIEGFETPFPVEVMGDSVYADILLNDTLFSIGKQDVLTQFRGHQILNKKLNNGDWEVLILSLDQDFDLVLSMASIPEDLELLESITPVTELSRGDTIQYKIAPTVYEFSRILEEELIFEACDYYKRIALPIEI